MQVELSPATLILDGGGASPLMKQVFAAAQWPRSRLAGDKHAFTSPALHQPNQENSNDFHFLIAGVSQVWHYGLTSPLGARWLIADGRDPFKVHPAHPPPAQRRQPSFLSPSTSSSSLCHCTVRGRAQLDARATFPSTPAIKESLHILEECLWPHAGAVASGSGRDNRTFFACTVMRGPVRQILFSVNSVYTDKSSTSGRSMGWGETLGGLGATPGRAGDA